MGLYSTKMGEKTSTLVAQDKTGLTHSRLKQEADRCKLDLLTQRELLQGMSKEPQPQSPADREILKQEIDDQLGQINEYKEAVDQLKFENLDVFAKIENSSKMCQTKHSPIREDTLKLEFRPTSLTVNTTFLE